ncbi:MAG: AI-2E family transporter [Pseudomonadota bacterium]
MPDGVGSVERAPVRSTRDGIVFAFAVAAGIALVVLTARILLVLFAGVLFALALRAVATFAAKHLRVPYKAAVAASVLLLVAVTVGGGYLTLPALAAQVSQVAKSLPDGVQRVSQTLHVPLGKPEDWLGSAEKSVLRVVGAVGTSFEVLGGFVVLFFVGVYGAADPESYAKILLWFAPSSKKRTVRRVLEVSAGNLQRWLLGRLVAMLFVGLTSGIAFAVLKVPLALPLAVLAGLLTFVEYIGAFASAVPPILLALTESPSRALWVAAVFGVLHVIEGYILTPLLAKTAVRFPPATTLASQALLSALLGPLGLTFATPLLVVIVTAAQEWRKGS